MGKKFKESETVVLERWDNGRTERCTIKSRTESKAVLTGADGKPKYASIRPVRSPNGECLDVAGFNAVFTHRTAESSDGGLERARELIDEIRQLNAEGRSIHFICEALGIYHQAVTNVMKENGIVPVYLSRQTTFADHEVQTIKDMAAQGLSQAEIVKLTGMSINKVRTAYVKHGIQTQKCGRKRADVPTIEDDQLPAVRRMIADGCSAREIASEFGVSEFKARMFVMKHGLEFRRGALGENDLAKIRKWYAEGMSKAAIGRELKVSVPTINRFMAQNGGFDGQD